MRILKSTLLAGLISLFVSFSSFAEKETILNLQMLKSKIEKLKKKVKFERKWAAKGKK